MAKTDTIRPDEGLIRAVAKEICIKAQCEPGFCYMDVPGSDERPVIEEEVRAQFGSTCVSCRNVAVGAINAMLNYQDAHKEELTGDE